MLMRLLLDQPEAKKPEELNFPTTPKNHDFDFLPVGYITCCFLN